MGRGGRVGRGVGGSALISGVGGILDSDRSFRSGSFSL